MSYSNSGLRAHCKSFEALNSDMFFCQLGQEMLKTTNPRPVIQDAVMNLTEIASYLFREESLEFAVHGSQSKFSLIEFKLEMLLNQMKNNNSRYSEKLPVV